MRAIAILSFIVPLSGFAAELPRLELISREGLTAHLRIANASNQRAFFSPYIIIEEFYDKPACEGCAQGWIATRPRPLGEAVSLESGSSYKFDAPTSFRPTRITVFSALSPSTKKDDYTPLRIELPALERPPATSGARNEVSAELSNEEKRKRIVHNLRMIAAAGDQCLLRNGIRSANMTTIVRDFPDEMKKILVAIDGEDYSDIVYTADATLSVDTDTLGRIQYPEK